MIVGTHRGPAIGRDAGGPAPAIGRAGPACGSIGRMKDVYGGLPPAPEESLNRVVQLFQAMLPNALELWAIYRGWRADRAANAAANAELETIFGESANELSADRWEFFSLVCIPGAPEGGRIETPPGAGWELLSYRQVLDEVGTVHTFWKRRRSPRSVVGVE